MNQRKWGAWLLLLCLLAGLLAGCGQPEESLQELLGLGSRYLSEGSYEDAVVAFEKAIRVDDKCVEAYLGLADAYIGLNDYEAAIEALERGLKKTGDESIRVKLEGLKKQVEDGEINDEEDLSASYRLVEEDVMVRAAYEKVAAGRTFAEIKAEFGPVVDIYEGGHASDIGVRHQRGAGIFYYRAEGESPFDGRLSDYKTAEEIPDYAYCYEQWIPFEELLPGFKANERPILELDKLSTMKFEGDFSLAGTSGEEESINWVTLSNSSDEYRWSFHYGVNKEGKADTDQAVVDASRF